MSNNFERRNAQTILSKLEVEAILSEHYASPINIQHLELAGAGLANTNYITFFDKNTVVLRIYNRSVKVAQKELEILKLLSSQQVVPELYFSDVKESNSLQYALIEFIKGDLLETLLPQKQQNLSKVFHQLGQFSGNLTKIRFPDQGLLDVNLNVKQINTSNKGYSQCVCFILDCLDNSLVQTRAGKKLCASLVSLAKDSNALLEKVTTNFHLIHGDFKSNNILAKQNNSTPSLSGIIDWEYARSDIIYADIATLFRGNYSRDAQLKRDFVSGFNTSSLYKLSDDWENIAKIMDLVNLLDFLASKEERSKLHENILWNLKETIDFFT